MIKKYLYIIAATLITSISGYAQEQKLSASEFSEQVNIYPNPTTNQRITIQTETNGTKEVEIFDMLGKRVAQVSFSGREKEIFLNNIKAGVYIIKIKEDNNSTSRKLVIK